MSFPADLEEAAKLDGCSTYECFTIAFPLSRPIIIPLSIRFFPETEQLPVAVDCK